jgi:hypothetical protein
VHMAAAGACTIAPRTRIAAQTWDHDPSSSIPCSARSHAETSALGRGPSANVRAARTETCCPSTARTASSRPCISTRISFPLPRRRPRRKAIRCGGSPG